ncbi:hypothetical protein GCM10010399_81180 [Dactylosporangium fulvum]|uniref:DUF998 domain-containing protein n=1 Tax=Dactylosporangium fulvum TaxID=53359 RepID=A0ABY5VNP6_9ACTN|nr:hypothetical protein [Dactylosporangium fulvum]UWP79352.1 hypothetical protein Dfulv_29815 [Dactylosporangium fulvum]
MTAPKDAGPTPAGLGARVVALVGGIAALLALALPWASEDNTITVRSDASPVTYEALLARGGEEWTGWGIHAASRLDGHRPVTLLVAMVIVTGTVLVAGTAWATFERPRRIWLAPATAGIALLLLTASFPGLAGVQGRFGGGHITSVEFGVVVWRVSLAVVVAGAVRLALLQEAARPGRRTYQ